jgi:hypothetical protein
MGASRAVAALALVTVSLIVPVSRSLAGSPAKASQATNAFAQYIQHRFADARGYWTCPAAQIAGSDASCLAELRVGRFRHLFSATFDVSASGATLVNSFDKRWARRWSAYSHGLISGFSTPGTASVNGRGFDWVWLAAGAYAGRNHRDAFIVDSYDGNGTGWGAFYNFTCGHHGSVIQCTNAFGDSIRYRP